VNRAALQAIHLDPLLAEAHAAMAVNNFAYIWDWETAEQEFSRAIGINSGNPLIYHAYASFLIAMGRFSEADENMRIAQKIDPLSHVSNNSMAYPLFFSRQYDQAISELNKAIDIDSYFPLSYKILGDIFVEKEMYEDSITAYEKAIDLMGKQPVQLA